MVSYASNLRVTLQETECKVTSGGYLAAFMHLTGLEAGVTQLLAVRSWVECRQPGQDDTCLASSAQLEGVMPPFTPGYCRTGICHTRSLLMCRCDC